MIVNGPIPFDYTEAMRNQRVERLSKLLPGAKEEHTIPRRTSHPSETSSKTNPKADPKISIIDKLKKEHKYRPGEKLDLSSANLFGGSLPYQVTRSRPTKSELTESEIMEARLVSASHKAYKHQDLERAQSYLDIDESTSGWQVDKNLSNFDHLVLTKGVGSAKQLRVVARGTEWSRGPDINDLRTDYEAIRGGMGNDPQTIRIRDALRQALRDHQVTKAQTRLNGYSKSGAQMMHVGDLEGVRTNLFNPLLGPDQINSKSSIKHRIITTTEDLASIASHIYDKDNWSVDRIRAIRGGKWNAWMQHRLANFTKRGARQPSGLEENASKSARLGLKYANYDMLHMMKSDIEDGKSFTRSMKEFGGMTNEDTHFGDIEDSQITRLTERASYSSPHVENWQRMGGKFSAIEHEHLNNTPKPYTPDSIGVESFGGVPLSKIPEKEITDFASQPKMQREARLEDMHDEMKKTMEETTNVAESHATRAMDFIPTPVQAGKGMIAGIVASKISSSIDPDNKFGEDAHSLATGALAARLAAGTAISAPVAAGAALGWDAGVRSSKYFDTELKKTGMNKDAADAISSSSGGAVGGFVGVAATGSLGIASDIALGTEFGSAGGPIGAAIGAGVGAVFGGLGWAAHHFGWFGL